MQLLVSLLNVSGHATDEVTLVLLFVPLIEGADGGVLRGLQSEQRGRDQETRTKFERRKR